MVVVKIERLVFIIVVVVAVVVVAHRSGHLQPR